MADEEDELLENEEIEHPDEYNDEEGDDVDDDDDDEIGILERLRLQFRGRIDQDKDIKRPEKITYDPALPTTHAYLGTDLEDYSGRTVLDDECSISLPLVQLPGVVLVPGETIPLHFFNPRIISMMKHILQNNRTFGMLYDSQERPSSRREISVPDLGTTAEIFSAKEEDDGGIETMRMKAMGRQRFKVMETRRQADGILIGQVMILPERCLPDVLCTARRRSLGRRRMVPHHISPSAKDGGMQWLKERRKRHLSEADLTWWPPWVYEMYDEDALMVKIKNELRGWYENSLQLKQMPATPSDFSFWVASNMPLDDAGRIGLLKIDSAVQRLRRELELLQKCTVLCCRECSTQIANKSDVFCMSLDGPMAAYVNPGGYVHETLTVYRAQNLNLIGRPSKENSWFPGYAWTILQCRRCTSHMGWKFTATEKNFKPEKFWGLTRSALKTGLQTDEE
ncbi:protein cereblon-like isoform X1 [Lytechinus pictus]|uniref:protein cereblon-like isoform X1 n=1 Tax=Lytechinus pictus TaxID=7653 RepID=UPI0030B9FD04